MHLRCMGMLFSYWLEFWSFIFITSRLFQFMCVHFVFLTFIITVGLFCTNVYNSNYNTSVHNLASSGSSAKFITITIYTMSHYIVRRGELSGLLS